MAYTPFDASLPDVSIGSRKDNFDAARNNETALADILASLGWMDNFDITIGAGTAAQPTQILCTNGTQVVKVDITYGAGVTADLPVTIDLHKSTNSGSSYSAIRTATIAYDGAGAFVSLTWA